MWMWGSSDLPRQLTGWAFKGQRMWGGQGSDRPFLKIFYQGTGNWMCWVTGALSKPANPGFCCAYTTRLVQYGRYACSGWVWAFLLVILYYDLHLSLAWSVTNLACGFTFKTSTVLSGYVSLFDQWSICSQVAKLTMFWCHAIMFCSRTINSF